jgi:glycosyltransferase involved in cell wall biosynthesis
MSERIRVLYYYSHLHTDTGSPNALCGMITLLDKCRFEPVFLANGDGPLVSALIEKGVEIHMGAVSEVHWTAPLLALRSIWQQFVQLRKMRIDLVHINEFGRNLDLVVGAYLAGVPVVLHIHNPETIKRTNLHIFAASKILVVSKAAIQSVRYFDRIASKCSVLYNCADFNKISRGRSIRDALGFQTDDILIGTIAQLTPEKGTDIVLATARLLLPRFPQLHFLLAGRIGEGAEEFVGEMKRLAGEGSLAGRIHFLGIRSDVADLLATINLFFLPTQAETFCLAVLEAMVAGVPVVASRVGALSELIPDPGAGTLVEPRTPESFARAITEILESSDRGSRLGQHGCKSLRGRLDPDACRSQLIQVYENALGWEMRSIS